MTGKRTFLSAFTKTMEFEGGYSFDALDPGGETYMGISRVYWPDWPGWELIDQLNAADKRVENLPVLEAMVRRFYRQQYWNRFHGDAVADIVPEVAEEVFDTGVNLGVHRAVKFLQQALNLLNLNETIFPDIIEDGILGQVTLRTMQLYMERRPPDRETKIRMLLGVMNTLQGMHYIEQMRRYPEKERFRGWFMRV